MRVVIRLQQAGYRNHPRWKIVVIPQKKNPRGRYLEHLGWWQPRQGTITQREIVINKDRARYWLAMGALPSPTVQKFLSYYDLAPKPLIKFGYKTVYEREKPVVKDYLRLNPYKIINFDHQLHKFVEQEEEAKFLKQERMKNELIKQIGAKNINASVDSKEILNEIQSLQNELQEISNQINQVDVARRQIITKKINSLFPQLIKAEKFEAYKQQVSQGKLQLQGQIGQEKYLKRSLEAAHVSQRLQNDMNNLDEQIEVLKPISREEFKDFLLTKGFIEAKAEKTVRKYYTDHQVVMKIHAIEATTEVPEIEHENQLHLEHYRIDEYQLHYIDNALQYSHCQMVLLQDQISIVMMLLITMRFLISLILHFKEIKASFLFIFKLNSQMIINQLAYTLPGVSDKINPVKKEYPKWRAKNVNGGKKPRRTRTQNPPMKHFSTISSAYMSQLQYLKYTGVIPE